MTNCLFPLSLSLICQWGITIISQLCSVGKGYICEALIQLLAYHQHFILMLFYYWHWGLFLAVRAWGKHPSLLLFGYVLSPRDYQYASPKFSSSMASPSELERVSLQLECESVSLLLGLPGYLASSLFQDKMFGFYDVHFKYKTLAT